MGKMGLISRAKILNIQWVYSSTEGALSATPRIHSVTEYQFALSTQIERTESALSAWIDP